MSLEKAIKHGKEHRRRYYGSRAIAHSCRSHGSCLFCRRSRLRYQRLAGLIRCADAARGEGSDEE